MFTWRWYFLAFLNISKSYLDHCVLLAFLLLLWNYGIFQLLFITTSYFIWDWTRWKSWAFASFLLQSSRDLFVPWIIGISPLHLHHNHISCIGTRRKSSMNSIPPCTEHQNACNCGVFQFKKDFPNWKQIPQSL